MQTHAHSEDLAGQAAAPEVGEPVALGRPVLVTTEYRGVFFGYAEDTSGDVIVLRRARNCIYWPSTQGGFGGLASEGPAAGARIGARVDRIELRKITSVADITTAAAAAWEAANVHRG
jgi:hypothetical protein